MDNDFTIDTGAYTQFDALTIKQYIKDVLTNGGSEFTDQNFEGSNLSSFIDIIAYMFNVMMYYLNQTSTENLYTEAQLYENINRIVKMLGYNPVGNQTSILPYDVTLAPTITNGTYNIPRFSYINIGSTTYSFPNDVVFTKDNLNSDVERLLYQGKFIEYPTQTSIGELNEVFYLNPGINVNIDHFNMNVFINNGNIWSEYTQVDSLFLSSPTDLHYMCRLNENKVYEFTFGNGVMGKKLKPSDVVAIYYLETDGSGNDIPVNTLSDDMDYIAFASAQLTEIMIDVNSDKFLGVIMPSGGALFSNESPSSPYGDAETVDEIRDNANIAYRSKTALVKPVAFDTFYRNNFSNIIADVKCVDNDTYCDEYLKYFYDLGVTKIDRISRVLYNHTLYSNSCNFNNIYVFTKPTIDYSKAIDGDYDRFTSSGFKDLLVDSVDDYMAFNTEVVPADPVYMAIGFGFNPVNDALTPSDSENTKLVVVREEKSFRGVDAIKSDIANIVDGYFSYENVNFGFTIDVSQIATDIVNVEGVDTFYLSEITGTLTQSSLSFIMWNPIYPVDIDDITYKVSLPFFKIPYMHNRDSLLDKIEVI